MKRIEVEAIKRRRKKERKDERVLVCMHPYACVLWLRIAVQEVQRKGHREWKTPNPTQAQVP